MPELASQKGTHRGFHVCRGALKFAIGVVTTAAPAAALATYTGAGPEPL